MDDENPNQCEQQCLEMEERLAETEHDWKAAPFVADEGGMWAAVRCEVHDITVWLVSIGHNQYRSVWVHPEGLSMWSDMTHTNLKYSAWRAVMDAGHTARHFEKEIARREAKEPEEVQLWLITRRINTQSMHMLESVRIRHVAGSEEEAEQLRSSSEDAVPVTFSIEALKNLRSALRIEELLDDKLSNLERGFDKPHD